MSKAHAEVTFERSLKVVHFQEDDVPNLAGIGQGSVRF